MEIVEIHEFSTGINAEILADGSWRLRGFTGNYMNSTLPQILNTVKRAIANDLFTVSKDRHSQEPTFIGRVVLGNKESDWSVVAVATPGQDVHGRYTSFYRYFLCEGCDSLWKIIYWMEDYKQKHQRYPVFNPNKQKVTSQQNILSVANKPILQFNSNAQEFLRQQKMLILPSGVVINLQEINQRAEVIATGQNKAVSWAYNVEALESPDLFLIIHPANEKSYNILKLNQAVDGIGIETAIKGLISGSQVKDEWIQTFLYSLQGKILNEAQWENIFAVQGAGNAIKNRMTTPQMIRLLTLRAIALPRTLSEFLRWLLNNRKCNIKELSHQQEIFLDFQIALINRLDDLREYFKDGIQVLLKLVLGKQMPIVVVIWLLTARGSVWARYRDEIIQDIRSDLIIIERLFRNNNNLPKSPAFRCGRDIWEDLYSCWKTGFYYSKAYKPFAQLFAEVSELKPGELNCYDLSAYFYQVSYREVPTDVFKKALPNLRRDEGMIYGLTVKRKIPILEQCLILIIRYSRVVAFTTLSVFVLIVFFVLGANYGFNKGFNKGFSQGKKEINMKLRNNPVPHKQMLESDKTVAMEKFRDTIEAINAIADELTQLPNKKTGEFLGRQEIIEQIKNTLVADQDFFVQKLDYDKAISQRWFELGFDFSGEIEEARKNWVEAVYFYQKQKNLAPDGIIDLYGPTYMLLKADVKERLLKNLENR